MKITSKLILQYAKDLNVLYVEDDTEVLQSTAKTLKNYFKSVDTATDGKDGLEKYDSFYKKNDTYYDIVFSDINMPIMDGIKMSKSIIKENHEQSIIFITAHNELDNLHNALKIGASGFLTKPINFENFKTLLYKTSQAIHDRKIILKHYNDLEESNFSLHENVNKPKFNNKSYTHAKDIIDDIDAHKEMIVNEWINSDATSKKLHKHVIDNDYFIHRYGIKVFEYFIGVIKGTNEVGNCPVIVTMLEFLKHKNLPLDSIFIICVNFKNTITSYIFDRYEFNHNIFDEISIVLDKNFEGVVVNYMDMLKQKNKKTEKEITPALDTNLDTKKKNNGLECITKIDYNDYVFDHDIYEFQDLEVEIDNLAIAAVTMNNKSNAENFNILGTKIAKYGSLLITYPIFQDLGTYIFKLGNNFTENAQLLQEDNEKVSNISILLEGFVNDLMIWRKEIFENNIEDYTFLNASFFSNVDTIIQYIEYDEANDTSDEDDIEFF